jgi:methionine aminopeptidase
MSDDNWTALACMLWDDPIDYTEMEMGRRKIESIIEFLPRILVEGKTFGQAVDELLELLHPYKECCLDLIPEEEPFHSCPKKRVIKEGEIVTLDCSLKADRLWADRAYTFAVGTVDEHRLTLLDMARDAFYTVRDASLPGVSFRAIIEQLESLLEKSPCFLVPKCGGHGIGYSLHQGEEFIYSDRESTMTIPHKGAFTVEPVIGLEYNGVILYAYFEDTIILN